MNKEAKHWVVAWVLPKIQGAFDFEGTIARGLNMTNETMTVFAENVTQSLCDCLMGVDPSHFLTMSVEHLWSSKDVFNPETGEMMNWGKNHLFSVKYELLIWDVNTFLFNWDALHHILVAGSSVHSKFEGLLMGKSNMTLVELFPTNYPITYNLTYIAPDSEISAASPAFTDMRRLVLALALLNSVMLLLSGSTGTANQH